MAILKDSTRAGFLLPLDDDLTLEDEALENAIHDYIAGTTGLAGTMVRPAYQEEASPLPDNWPCDWIAFQVNEQDQPFDSPRRHLSSEAQGEGWNDGGYGEGGFGGPSGIDQVRATEEISVRLSFYGPKAIKYMQRYRMGAQIPQNRDELRRLGLSLIEIRKPLQVPEKIKGRWWNRQDSITRLRRTVQFTYPVRDLAGASVNITDGDQITIVDDTGTIAG